jgi:two-component system response regulator AtoC
MRFLMDPQLIGASPSIMNIRELVRVVANTALSVIIYGETGVGKEVIARELHRLSDRRTKRFVKVNCAALPTELLESELFGYERGAFTGATRFKPGKFEIASEGVIFLDEVGDIPLPLQAKLLQVLQNGEFSRLGGKEVKVNTWVISATNHDLAADMKEGRFREDLYYRLNIIKIDVPALRERTEDVPLLVDYFTEKYRSELEITEPFTIDPQMMDLFMGYEWPGNVRELANTIQRLMVMGEWDAVEEKLSLGAEGSPLIAGTTGDTSHQAPASERIIPLKQVKARAADYIEKRLISHALQVSGGNKARAARALHISYKALFYKMRGLGLR